MDESESVLINEVMDDKNKLPPRDTSSNIKRATFLASSGVRALSDSIISPFIPLYGKSLNATSTQIGLIVSMTGLLSIVQLLWAFISQRYKITRGLAIIASYLSSIFTFLLIPFRNIFYFASMRGAQSVILSATLPTSSNLIAERTPHRAWPLLNSLLQGILVFGTLIGTLIGGVILWKVPATMSFILIFVCSGVISILASILFHISIPSQKKLESKGRWQIIEEVDVSINNTFAIMKTERNFLIFCIVNFIFVFGVNLTGPFFIIFNTTHYDLTVFHTSLLTAIGLIPQTIFSIITAKFIERVRKKELLIVAGIFTACFPVFFMIPSLAGRVTNVFWILIIIWCVNGIAWGVVNSSLTVLLLDIIHPRRRTLQLAINNSLSAISLFIAPILGGLIIEKTSSIYLVLILSASFRVLGVLLFSLIKEPIIGGTILRPIQRIMPFIIRNNAERGISIITQTRISKPKRRNKISK